MDISIWRQLLDEDILALLIPIVVIVSVAVIVIVKRVFSHRERMAMIERGIHPDYPPADDEEKQNPSTKR